LELQHTKSSRAEQVSISFTNKFLLTKPFSAKYLKKLTGKNDIEGSLKRLGRLTEEEARMASAQLLKITNTIDSEVKGIADSVLLVGERVAGIDDRVAGVDERVAGVNEHVAGVDDRVKDINDRIKVVDDKLVAVFDGVQYVVDRHRRLF
jgi:hypothetical protein